MAMRGKSRRRFLIESVSGLGGVWVAANYPAILAAEEFVRSAPEPPPFAFFGPDEALQVEAMAEQIIPSDDTPGAREARVVHFVDRALVTFDSDRQEDYKSGLAELEEAVRRRYPGSDRFSDLIFDQQLQVMTDLEGTPFFELVRTHTITGFFASPVHGGNHQKVGWQLLGYDDSLSHEPPFGYYDALPRAQRSS